MNPDKIKDCEFDFKLKLIPPPGYPKWDICKEIKDDFLAPPWVQEQCHVNCKMFRKCCKSSAILEEREKKKQKTKLKQEEAKRIKRKKLIDDIMIEMDEKDKDKMVNLSSQISSDLEKTSDLSQVSQVSTYSQDTTPSKSISKKKKVFVSVSVRKRMKHPPPDSNASKGSLITNYAKKPKKKVLTPALQSSQSSQNSHCPRSAVNYVAHLKEDHFDSSQAVSHSPSTLVNVSNSVASSNKKTNSNNNKDSDGEDSVSVEKMVLPPSVMCDPCKVRPGKCHMYLSMFPKCCEILYWDMCLHVVMDYFDDVGVFNATHLVHVKHFTSASCPK